MQKQINQKEFLKKNQHRVEILPFSEKPAKKENKLFGLLESDFLTLDLLIFYLHKRFHQIGVRNYLINKLYHLKEDDLTFYIPELCYLIIKRASPELERFLLDKCSKSIPLYFQIHWSLSSYGEANINEPEKFEKLKKIIKFCELSMINHERIDENMNERAIRYDLKDPQSFLSYIEINEN